MQRREFLRSALVVPAVVGAGASWPGQAARAMVPGPGPVNQHGTTLSLAYWSANRAWMMAADASAKPADAVSPLLSLPGRHFAETLAALGLVADNAPINAAGTIAHTAPGDTEHNAPNGLIAPADFAGASGAGDDGTAVAALCGLLTDTDLTAADIAAWITGTAATDIWAELVRPDGWHPVPIGILAPTAAALRTQTPSIASCASAGLTRRTLEGALPGGTTDLFAGQAVGGDYVGATSAALIAAYGEAGGAMTPANWRTITTPGTTATGPLIAAFFDLDWWRAQPVARQRAIETAATATVHWHLAQQHMAGRMLALSVPAFAFPQHRTLADDAEWIDALTPAREACAADIRGSAAAAAMIGPLIELGRASQSRYPSA